MSYLSKCFDEGLKEKSGKKVGKKWEKKMEIEYSNSTLNSKFEWPKGYEFWLKKK